MSRIGSGTKASWYARIKASVVYVALAVALGLVAVLSLQARTQRGELRRYQYRTMHPYPGMWVPTVRAATLAGDSVTIGRTALGRRQVLIAFTTTCDFCRQSIPRWKRLSAELVADTTHQAEVFWLSLSSADSTRRYVREHQIAFPVIKLPEAKLERVYRTNAVPVIVVLSDSGRVVYSRAAVLSTRAAIDSVLAAVRARLQSPPCAVRLTRADCP
ncbi:MAG: redoxin domain-containing protein [Gemmatimonadaceae bacterium]